MIPAGVSGGQGGVKQGDKTSSFYQGDSTNYGITFGFSPHADYAAAVKTSQVPAQADGSSLLVAGAAVLAIAAGAWYLNRRK